MGFMEKFQEAVRLDEENELSQSMLLWTQLATDNPDNANVNYKAGRAYLNTLNMKTAAMPFLAKAVKSDIEKNYDPISPYEKKVPIEVYYYYARALHLNYKLDDARVYYERFMLGAPVKHQLFAKANLGTEQVGHARLLMKIPVEFEIENLGSVINSEYPDFSPVISIDENALFYTSARVRQDSSNYYVKDKTTGKYFEDIYASYKGVDGEWQEPELLSINTTNHTATMNVSVDGQTLYLYRDDTGNGDIYQSKLVGETWSEPQAMPGVINSPAWETHLAPTPDGRTIYFVSNRKGGLGGRDIYRVNMLPDGNWSEAENLGAKINTQYEEDAVFVSPDARTLYFSSQGHNSMGGFDILYSRIDETTGEWSEPTNIGYPINTVDDDVFFVTSADGKRAYYSSERNDGFGEKDIYMIKLPNPQRVNIALLKGKIISADGSDLPDDILVYITDRKSGKKDLFTPRMQDGVFVAILPPCADYDVDYSINGKIAARDTFSIGCELDYEEIYKELLLRPITIMEDGSAIFASSTSGTAKPATYRTNFSYNQKILDAEAALFASFMRNVKKIVDSNGKVDITILSSASKVPTKTYKSNDVLADKRANDAKLRVLQEAKNLGIDSDKLNFRSVKGSVQGPEYEGDYIKGAEKYEKFQYTDIEAR